MSAAKCCPRSRAAAGERSAPAVRAKGSDVTLVGCSLLRAYLCEQAAKQLGERGISAEVIDARVLETVRRYGDPAVRWRNPPPVCLSTVAGGRPASAAKVIARVCEEVDGLKSRPLFVSPRRTRRRPRASRSKRSTIRQPLQLWIA